MKREGRFPISSIDRREFFTGAASFAALGMSPFAFADDASDSPALAAHQCLKLKKKKEK